MKISPAQIKLQILLREKRISKKMRQIELSQILEKPQSFVSKYENGERRLDCVQVREICLILGISMPALITEWEEKLNETQ